MHIGEVGSWDLCPIGEVVTGFRVRYDGRNPASNDITGITGIILICENSLEVSSSQYELTPSPAPGAQIPRPVPEATTSPGGAA